MVSCKLSQKENENESEITNKTREREWGARENTTYKRIIYWISSNSIFIWFDWFWTASNEDFG
jgi:hypothetical protein